MCFIHTQHYISIGSATEPRDAYISNPREMLERPTRRSQIQEAGLREAQAERAAMLQCNPAFWPQRNTTGHIGAENALPSGNTVLECRDPHFRGVGIGTGTVVYAIFLLSVCEYLYHSSVVGANGDGRQLPWDCGGPKSISRVH
jgi:hypothetical protein